MKREFVQHFQLFNIYIEQGAKVILASHLVVQKVKWKKNLRLTPVAKRLAELLGKDVKKADEAYGESVKALIAEMKKAMFFFLKTFVSILVKKRMIQNLAKAFAELSRCLCK